MSRKKMKERKTKAKERAVYEKKVKKRMFNIRKKKEERIKDKLEHKYREKAEPIRKQPLVEENLNHNLEVLKALEEEYIASQRAKKDLHDELEAEGYKTIEEKLEALKKKSADIVEKIQRDVEAEAVGQLPLPQGQGLVNPK